jgi:ABC-type glycerol-3-phosphate transport system substrate-binding protein
MTLLNFLNTKKLFYVLVGAIAFILFISVILILRNIGGPSIEQADLEFWGVFDTRQDFAKAIKSFQQNDQGIKITYKQFSFEDYERALIDALAAGAGPDLIMFHHTWLKEHRNKFAPMPEISSITNLPFIIPTQFKEQFVDVAYDDLVYQDQIYGIPLYVDTLALYYNKDMFNTAGITMPPTDWDDFNDNVELLTKFDNQGNIIQAGAAIGTARNINRSTDILSALMVQNGTRMNNATNTLVTFTRSVDGKRVGENALEYYTDFANPLKSVYTWNDSQHYSIDAFIQEEVAMMFNYSHQIPIVQKRFERLNFSVAPMPQFSELDTKNYANYWAIGVSGASDHKDAAWRFLSYLGSKNGTMEYLNETNRPSARRDIIDVQRNDPQLGVFAVQALSAKSWTQIDNVAVEQIFADMIEDVNFKREDVRRALRAAESSLNTLMSRQP